ncbi:TIGR00730 family Rossman fold protein [Egicoccus sp. AB-alg2]|uniref:LOG family protein n=1 Tax=Egicoccus sp. AB-alg2 TaxID=3242693 RepID=UPI00359D8267
MTTFTVYTSSSDAIDPRYPQVAATFGRRIGERGDRLVYGGTAVGVMGVLARAVREAGGHVTGVLPRLMHERGIADEACDELLVTDGMSDRKQHMVARADAFVALPGGFGTLEELLEVLTLKQLGYHDKPIVLLNVDGFYDPLLAFFEELYDTAFAAPVYRALYAVVSDVDALFAHVDTYAGTSVPAKWA